MYEVELKAHVKDRTAVIQKINSFARFDKIIIKDDEYFKLEREGQERIAARIRYEEQRTSDDKINFSEQKILAKKAFLTYKKKERRTDTNGVTTELNDERETELSDADCVKTLLLDSGFVPHFTKHKDTIGWYVDYEGRGYKEAHLELCSVPPLGDFLEIEIICKNEDSEIVNEINSELKNLIVKAGLSLDDIEKKYYSELLEEAKNV